MNSISADRKWLWVVAFAFVFEFAGCGGEPGVRSTVDTKIQCRSPNRPDAPATPIEGWKFDVVRTGILAALREKPSGLAAGAIPDCLPEFVSEAEIERLGNLEWLAEKVRLEMEVRGDIERIVIDGDQFVLRLTDQSQASPSLGATSK